MATRRPLVLSSGRKTELPLSDTLGGTEALLVVADMFGDYVVSGLLSPTSANLTSTLSAGSAYVIGVRVTKTATAKTYTASKDTYVDLSNAGVLTYAEVANGAAAPAVTSNSLRLQKVVTNGTAVTSVTQLGSLLSTLNRSFGKQTYGGGEGFVNKILGSAFSTTTRNFNFTGKSTPDQNLPGDARQNTVVSFGWNMAENGTREDVTDACMGLQFEEHYLQGGAGPAAFEWHLSTQDTSGLIHRPISAFMPKDGSAGNSSLSFGADVLNFTNYNNSSRIGMNFVNNTIDFNVSGLAIRALNNYGAFKQLNAAGNAYLDLPYYNTDNAITVPASIRVAGTTPATGIYPNIFAVFQATTLPANGVGFYMPLPNVTGSYRGFVLEGEPTVDHSFDLYNNNGAATANAVLHLRVISGAAGDPLIRYNVNGGTQWSVGLDNSDSDKFKWSTGALGAADKMVLDTAGLLTVESLGFGIATNDLILARAAANVGEQRNGTNAQGWLRYNTSSSSNANYERQFGRWVSNVYEIGTEAAGTGVARGMTFKVGATNVLTTDTGGNWSNWNSLRSSATGTTEIAMNYYNSGLLMGSAGAVGFGASNASTTDFALMRNTNGLGELNNGTLGVFRDLKLRHLIMTGLRAASAAAPTIASAATIAPTTEIAFVSGTAVVTTITPPSPISAGGGRFTLIPTGLWTWTTAGNIAIAGSAAVNISIDFTYDVTTGKWYPTKI